MFLNISRSSVEVFAASAKYIEHEYRQSANTRKEKANWFLPLCLCLRGTRLSYVDKVLLQQSLYKRLFLCLHRQRNPDFKLLRKTTKRLSLKNMICLLKIITCLLISRPFGDFKLSSHKNQVLLTLLITAIFATAFKILNQIPMSCARWATGLLRSHTILSESILISNTLLASAKNGASGNAATKMVMKPN